MTLGDKTHAFYKDSVNSFIHLNIALSVDDVDDGDVNSNGDTIILANGESSLSGLSLEKLSVFDLKKLLKRTVFFTGDS